MNTLDELRATLDHHADGLQDTERLVRARSVRSRVRKARQRRAGAVAVTAAVAVVLAVGGVGLVHDGGTTEPSGPTLDDVRVPQQISVHGFGYRLADTVQASADGTIDLADATDTRPVTLVATGLGSGQATLYAGYWPVARVRGGEQVSPVTTDATTDLRVEFEGTPDSARAEVAVYEPDGELPPGVAHDGVVFRQRWGDQELVAGAFGEAGGVATAEVSDIQRTMNVSAYCESPTTDLWLHVAGNTGAMPCDDLDSGADPGPANQDWLLGPQPGQHTYSVYVTRGEDGPRADGVDVTFGFGVYREVDLGTEVLGQEMLTVIEYAGRTWRLDEVLDEVLDEEAGQDYHVDTAQGDALIAVPYDDVLSLSVSWTGAPEGGWGGIPPLDKPEGPGGIYVGVLLAGEDTVQVDVTGPDAETRLLVYRPVSQ